MDQGTATTHLDPDTSERFTPLRRQLGVTSFGINQIVLQPRQRGRIHRHERQEEVYLVLEGEETTLEQGALIRVAPDVRRQLVNRGPGRLVLLAVGGATEHDGRDGAAFIDWDATESASPQDVPLPEDLPPETS